MASTKATPPDTPPPASWGYSKRCSAHEDLAERVARVDERTAHILEGVSALQASVQGLTVKVDRQQTEQVARDIASAKAAALLSGTWGGAVKVISIGVAAIAALGGILGVGIAVVTVVLKLVEGN